MKKNLILFVLLGLLFAIPNNTFALTNNNNVEMSQEQYNKLVAVFGKASVDNMSQEIFDIEQEKEYEYLGEETVYVESRYKVDANGNVSNIREIEISEEEFENVDETQNTGISLYGAIWETTYKKLTMTMFGVNPGSDSGYTGIKFLLTNTWKIMPAVRSYDIMAFRYFNFIPNTSTVWGQLIYKDTSGTVGQNYTSNSSGFYAPYGISTGGFGISMKLPSSSSVYHIESSISIEGNGTAGTNYGMYGTYQHAVKTIAEEMTKQYIISSNGLGGVIDFRSSSLTAYYDAMQGVSNGGYDFVY